MLNIDQPVQSNLGPELASQGQYTPTYACLLPTLSPCEASSLVVAALGGDVLATDSAYILHTVLRRNILANAQAISPSARVQARELDWTVPASVWSWSDSLSITNPSSTQKEDLLIPPFDIIFTADTVYSPTLVQPLLDTIYALSNLSNRPPPCYLCIERRDPPLVDAFLTRAREMGFSVSRIAHQKLVRALERADVHWSKDDWDAVELWKLHLTRARLSTTVNNNNNNNS